MMPDDTNCDKCGREVPPENDIVFLGIELGDPVAAFAKSRHLLPVIEDGIGICEGSPSRAQYLEGQPRDHRTEYPYFPELEAIHREAYRKMQKYAEDERRERLRESN